MNAPKRFRDGLTAVDWLANYMATEGPAVETAELFEAAKRNGISRRTVQRARLELNIDIEYLTAFSGRRTRWVVVPRRPF